MSELDKDLLLNEIMGTFVRKEDYQGPRFFEAPFADKRPGGIDPTTSGFTLSHCATLESWQRNVIVNLGGANGRDQYIIARPGGGKTLPIICYWTNNLLGLNTMKTTVVGGNFRQSIRNLFDPSQRRNVPKILFLVPVIVLAQQTGMEIRQHLAKILMDAYESNPDEYINNYLVRPNDGVRIYQLWRQIQDTREQINDIYRTDPNNRDRNNLEIGNDTLQSLHKSLKLEVSERIKNLVDGMVYVKTGNSAPATTPFDDALVFVSIYESAPGFVNRIRNLNLTIVDEAHLIQESGVKNSDESRAVQIMGSLFTVLKSLRNHPNNRLVLLSGTINPKSAAAMTTYLNRCFDRNFEAPIAPEEASNRSQLSIVVNERIATDRGVTDSILKSVQQRDWGQLYVLFSTDRIRQIVEECVSKLGLRDVQNAQPNNYEPTNVFNGLGKRRQNEQNYNQLNTGADRLAIPSGMHLSVSNISNPLLRQAVLRGIGFIYRTIKGDALSNQKELLMNDNDKIIVAKLFRERKLNVLLATDAVGIGVNIDVKDLYIPGIQKFNPQVKNQVDASLRDLSQILNRAGRGDKAPIASIQTTQKNLEIITNALYSNPEDLPEVGAPDHGNFMCSAEIFLRFIDRFIPSINIRRIGAHVDFDGILRNRNNNNNGGVLGGGGFLP